MVTHTLVLIPGTFTSAVCGGGSAEEQNPIYTTCQLGYKAQLRPSSASTGMASSSGRRHSPHLWYMSPLLHSKIAIFSCLCRWILLFGLFSENDTLSISTVWQIYCAREKIWTLCSSTCCLMNMVPVVFEINSKKLLAYSKPCHCQDLSFSEIATH